MDLATFSRFKSKERKVQRKEKERKKKEKKKEERKTFVLETVCLGNIAGPHKYLFGTRLLKFWLYSKCPLVEIVLFTQRIAFFCIFPFQLHFNSISLNVLFAFKNITWEIGITAYSE